MTVSLQYAPCDIVSVNKDHIVLIRKDNKECIECTLDEIMPKVSPANAPAALLTAAAGPYFCGTAKQSDGSRIPERTIAAASAALVVGHWKIRGALLPSLNQLLCTCHGWMDG